MPDIQTTEAVENARKRLSETAEQKEAQNAAREPEKPAPQPSSDGKPKSKEDLIRGVSAKPKKKKFSTKLKEAFFGENIGDGSITENIFFRIFIPNLKRVLSDMANSAINSALGLDSRSRPLNGGYNSHQANAGIYRDRNYSNVNSVRSIRRNAISEETWDRETAADILSQMEEVLTQFPEEGLTIADVYSIMGFGERIRSTDRNWGWMSMRGIEMNCVDQYNDLWVIDMPPAKPL